MNQMLMIPLHRRFKPIIKVRDSFVETFCIEKDSYMEAM